MFWNDSKISEGDFRTVEFSSSLLHISHFSDSGWIDDYLEDSGFAVLGLIEAEDAGTLNLLSETSFFTIPFHMI